MFRLFFIGLLLLPMHGVPQLYLSGCDGDVVHLHAEVEYGTIQWMVNGQFIGEGDQHYTLSDSITLVELLADNGICSIVRKYTVYFTPCQTFYIPNAFTPDGDGLNDSFAIYGNVAYDLSIYDQWGTMLFQGSIPWPGNDIADLYAYKAIIHTSPQTTVYGRVQLVK